MVFGFFLLAAFETLSLLLRDAWHLPGFCQITHWYFLSTLPLTSAFVQRGLLYLSMQLKALYSSFRHLKNRKYRLCNNWQCQFSDNSYQPMSATSLYHSSRYQKQELYYLSSHSDGAQNPAKCKTDSQLVKCLDLSGTKSPL